MSVKNAASLKYLSFFSMVLALSLFSWARAADFTVQNITTVTVTETDLALSQGSLLFPDINISSEVISFDNVALHVVPEIFSSSLFITVRDEQQGGLYVAANDYDIIYENQHVATIDAVDNGKNGQAFSITFNDNATLAAVQAVVSNLAIINENPLSGELSFSAKIGNTPIITDDGIQFEVVENDLSPFIGTKINRYAKPALIDIDGDQDFDLVMGDDDGKIYFFRNTGDASEPEFTAVTGEQNPFEGIDVGSRSAPAFADLDADGDLDLYVGEKYGHIYGYLNIGDEVNPEFSAIPVQESPFSDIDIDADVTRTDPLYEGGNATPSFVDIDSDGDLDLLIGELEGNLNFFENTGSVTSPEFSERADEANPFNEIYLGYNSVPFSSDINFDGDPDVFVGAYLSAKIFYFSNQGSNEQPTFVEVEYADAPIGPERYLRYPAPFLEDLDNDGDKDLVIGTYSDEIAYYLNTSHYVVTITEVNDPPDIQGESDLTILENTLDLWRYNATDEENHAITWSLSGVDSALFAISPYGEVYFLEKPNFESPGDTDANNVYVFSVVATDEEGAASEISVRVSVINQVVEYVDLALPTISEALLESQEGVALFTGLSIDQQPNDDSFANTTFSLQGMPSSAWVEFYNLPTGYTYMVESGEFYYESELVASVQDTSNGLNGNDLVLLFSQNVSNAVVATILQSIRYYDIQAESGLAELNVELGGETIVNSGVTFDELTDELNPFNRLDEVSQVIPLFIDIDADQDLDLLTSTTLYANTGTSNIPVFVAINENDNPFSQLDGSLPVFVDIDGDGDQDAFISNGTGTNAYYQNTGSAEVPEMTLMAPELDPLYGIDVRTYNTLSFVDFDQDGDWDAIVQDSDGEYQFVENTGTAELPLMEVVEAQFNPFLGVNGDYNSRLVFGDIDNDGDLDAVQRTSNGSLSVYINNSLDASISVSFEKDEQHFFTSINDGDNSFPAFADIDADGDDDFFIGKSDGSVEYYQNRQTTFAIEITYSNDAPVISGDSEVTLQENNRYVYTYQGTDEEGHNITWSLSGADSALFTLADGELVFVEKSDFESPKDNNADNIYEVNVIATDEEGASQELAVTVIVTNEDEPLFYGTAGITEVDYTELAAGNAIALFSNITLEDPDNTFAGQTLNLSGLPLSAEVSFTSDFGVSENTSSGEIFYQNALIGTVTYFEDGLKITFADAANNEAVRAVLQSLVYNDITAQAGSLTLNLTLGGIALHNTSATFALDNDNNPLSFVNVGLLAYPSMVDIDNDGDLDAFIGDAYGSIRFMLNEGNAETPVFTELNESENPLSVITDMKNPVLSFVDIDNDGDQDVFVGASGGEVRYFLNVGTADNAIFEEQPDELTPFSDDGFYITAAPTFADIDSDGDQDALIGESDGILHWYENTGTEAIPTMTEIIGEANPFENISFDLFLIPVLVDLDNDAEFEVYIGHRDGGVYRASFDPAEAPEWLEGVNVSSRAAPAFADTDNDGDLDIFIGNYDGTIDYFVNTSAFTVSIVDSGIPILSLPDPLVLPLQEPEGSYSVDNNTIQTFLSSASAFTNEESDIQVYNDAPDFFFEGTTVVTFSATSDEGLTTSAAQTVTIESDTDNDGYSNWEDAFPVIAAIAIDTDGDGLADDFVAGCDEDCQGDIIIDNDDDNDGIPDEEDEQPTNPGNAIARPSETGDLVKPLGTEYSSPVIFSFSEQNGTYSVTPVTGGQTVTFSGEYRKVWLYQLPDMNGNGAHEYGLFGIRNDEGYEERLQMFIRDSQTGNKVSTLNWLANWSLASVVILDDVTGDGITDIGLQGYFKEGFRPQLVVKDGLTNEGYQTYSFPNLWDAPRYMQFSDVNGDGVGEIALFGIVKRNGKFQVKVVDGTNKDNKLKAYNFPAKWVNADWYNVGDYNQDGEDDWGLLGQSVEDGRWQLTVKDGTDPKGAEAIYGWPELRNITLLRLADLTGDNIAEIGLGGKNTNGRWQLLIKDGQDRNSAISNVTWPGNNVSDGIYNIGDIDGDAKDDVALLEIVLKDEVGHVQFVIKFSKSDYTTEATLDMGSDWQTFPTISQFDIDGDGMPEWVAWGLDENGAVKSQAIAL